MKKWITVAEAAKIYKVPARTIRRWFSEGRMTVPPEDEPGSSRPRRHLLPHAEVEELVKKRRNGGLPFRRS